MTDQKRPMTRRQLADALTAERFEFTVPEYRTNTEPMHPVFSVATARERVKKDHDRGVDTPQWIRLLAEAPAELDQGLTDDDEEED